MIDDRVAYVALASVPGIGPVRLQTLLDACGSATGALSAPVAFLGALPGISRAAACAIHAAGRDAGLHEAELQVRRAEELGGRLLLPADAAFPPLLREIPDPPLLLFAKGDLALLERPAVAVVGSRDHTAYGVSACRRVVAEAVGAGLAVVSGMARGLDAAAHTHALDLGGATIGVLGNGLGVVYPAANRALYARVAETGLLLTEFPPGERPHVSSFPRRNRLISGLAVVTVVVEAAVGSGALITADAALEQGREVLAVPGPIDSAVSAGSNRLIRDGAAPFLEADDLLRHYPGLEGAARAEAGQATATRETTTTPRIADLPASLAPAERELATLLGLEPLHVDELAERAGRPMGELLATLCALEIGGIVIQEPGRRFRRIEA